MTAEEFSAYVSNPREFGNNVMPVYESQGEETLRLLGIFCGVLAVATKGRMPADQETIRYFGLHNRKREGDFFLFREILGAQVVRETHIASGDRCCTYRIID